MSYADKAIDPVTGKIRPFKEVFEAEIRAKQAARIAQIHAEREVEAAKSETQKRVEHFQNEYDHARRNDDHHRAKFLKVHLTTLQEQLASERAAESKAKAFAADRRIDLIRQEAHAIAQSGHISLPHSSQVDRDHAVSIAMSGDWPDPQSQYEAFREVMGRIEDENLAVIQRRAADAEIEAARKEVELAECAIQDAQIQQARAKREAVNGT